MNLHKRFIEIDGETLCTESYTLNKNAVIFHGAGKSNRTRYYMFANQLIEKGIGVVLVDFSRHGDSSGELADQSLRRRQIQAREVIRTLVPEGELYLLGFSMGAQTLCDTLPEYEIRTNSVLLGCPAVYADSVHSTVFGNNNFTKTIRQKDSWKTSCAFKQLKAYTKPIIVASGSKDEVIPKGVIDSLKSITPNTVYTEYAGVSHKLAPWLSDHEKELASLLNKLISSRVAKYVN